MFLFFLKSNNLFAQYELGFGFGGSLGFEINSSDKLGVNKMSKAKPEVYPIIELRYKRNVWEKLSLEFSPSFVRTNNEKMWLFPTHTGANRDLLVNHYLLPIKFNFEASVNERCNVMIGFGTFLDYTPKYFLFTGYDTINAVTLHNQIENENIINRKSRYTFSGGTLLAPISIAKDIEYEKPLIKMFHHGFCLSSQLDFKLSLRANLYVKFNLYKTINDFENKNEITVVSTDVTTGLDSVYNINYYQQFYKKYQGIDIKSSDINTRATFLIYNAILGIRYSVWKKETSFKAY